MIMVTGMLLEIGIGVPAAAALVVGYGVRGRSSRLFGPNVWHGPRDQKLIALTFDDGPSEWTPHILEILDPLNVHATFFQCGANVARLPQISRQVVQAGHEIGNHTYSHPRLITCSAERIRQEIADTQKALEDATGKNPRLFRAPYGLKWFGLRPALEEFGLTGVMWTTICYDWEWEADEIAELVLDKAANGAILCLHDGDRVKEKVDRRHTVKALQHFLPRLYERGFRFVPAGTFCPARYAGQSGKEPASRLT